MIHNSTILFYWVCFDAQRKIRSGRVWAVDSDALSARLIAVHLLPIHMRRSRWMWLYPRWWWRCWVRWQSREQLGCAQVAVFCRTIQALMAGGIPFIDALRVCAETATDRAVRQSAFEASLHIARGSSPGSAFAASAGRWPAVVPLMFSSAYGGGLFEELLLCLASVFEQEVAHRSDLGRAALLPVITGISACSVLGWALYLCLEQNGTQEKMRFFLMSAQWLWVYGVYLIGGLLVGIFGVLKLFDHCVALKIRRDFFILHQPLLGALIARAQSILFFTMLALLLRASVTVVDALTSMRLLFVNAYWQNVIEKIVMQLKQGHSLSVVMQQAPRVCVPAVFVAALATVTGTQSLAAICSNTAKILMSERNELMNRYVALLPPLLMVIIGMVIIGFFYVLGQVFSDSLGSVGIL